MGKSQYTARDHEKLCARAERILDREIKKPLGKRDEALIGECEELMLYCAERQKVLSAEAAKSSPAPRLKLRRIGVLAAVLLLLLALSATVAQAAGFRVWSALIHWDRNYLIVEYSDHRSDPPAYTASPLSGTHAPVQIGTPAVEKEVGSIDELIELSANKLLLPDMEGLAFNGATAAVLEDFSDFHISYSLEGNDFVIKATILKVGETHDSYSRIEQNGPFKEVYEKNINGVDCIFGAGKKTGLCVFKVGNDLYDIFGSLSTEQLEAIAYSMLIRKDITSGNERKLFAERHRNNNRRIDRFLCQQQQRVLYNQLAVTTM